MKESQLQRYLDGELTDSEVSEFLEAVQSDPSLEARLRGLEWALGAVDTEEESGLHAGFTNQVMTAITELKESRPDNSPPRPRRQSIGRLAMAAIWILTFGLGVVTSTSLKVSSLFDGSGADSPVSVAAESGGSDRALRPVRFAIALPDKDVARVQLAGSFNGWQPSRMPLRYQDGIWTATIFLDPGSYEYMFVVDGDEWITDPLAEVTRDDGFGNRNAVLDVGI